VTNIAVDPRAAAVEPDLASAEDLEVAERKERLSPGAWLAILWLVLIVVLAFGASYLPVGDPYANVAVIARKGLFQSGHILGGDVLGRDMLARTAFGAQHSLAISFGAIAMGFLIGGTLGLVAGYIGGKTDTFLTAIFDILLAFPALVLALTLVTFLKGQHVGPFDFSAQWVLVLALGLVSIPLLARITRASTLSWAQREFVLAARAQGARSTRIMFREVLPNVLPAMLALALLAVGIAMVAEAGLSVLGVGTPLPTPSWGNMIADGRSNLSDAPHIVFIPSIMIFLSVLSLNYLGDVIRDRFDVRESAI